MNTRNTNDYIRHGYLDYMDRNEKTKVYKSGPVFRYDETKRLK